MSTSQASGDVLEGYPAKSKKLQLRRSNPEPCAECSRSHVKCVRLGSYSNGTCQRCTKRKLGCRPKNPDGHPENSGRNLPIFRPYVQPYKVHESIDSNLSPSASEFGRVGQGSEIQANYPGVPTVTASGNYINHDGANVRYQNFSGTAINYGSCIDPRLLHSPGANTTSNFTACHHSPHVIGYTSSTSHITSGQASPYTASGYDMGRDSLPLAPTPHFAEQSFQYQPTYRNNMPIADTRTSFVPDTFAVDFSEIFDITGQHFG
ncbi:hypothetical protein BD410DRAFT_830618 [Rickenella mellea]|uniref:Zn(2)-C6 fungal-type domain-containing protein n=1 Tax=Rickenella mellea TaxID=50990 RepID=A0A4Y7PWG7_9AGAM|nr:hypothetical protein BD410DRAFT_830618 [Rickenella mellea]